MFRRLPYLRRFATVARHQYKFIDACPAPVKDTGCTYCEMPQLPPKYQIDHDRTLDGSIVRIYKQVLVLNGDPDHNEWPRRFEMSPGVISDLTALRKKYTDGFHPSMVNMTSLVEPADAGSDRLAVYPDGLEVVVPRDRRKEFVQAFMDGPGEGNEAELKKSLRQSFQTSQIDKDLVLICGHTIRDMRCGAIAPLIKQEFTRVLAKEMPEVPVGFISHVGGHIFAGNVLIFKKNGDVIWYGRVEPSHVQGIVEHTVLGNDIIKELYRGSATGLQEQ